MRWATERPFEKYSLLQLRECGGRQGGKCDVRAFRSVGEKRRLGRSRSVKAHQAVLAATAELLVEGGYPATTVDAIS
ncbi:MAG: hypothetical protein ACREN8_03415 [Candidatus Dormibacteraceae bacterium]